MGLVVDSYRFAVGGGPISYVGKGTFATATASTSYSLNLDAGHSTGDLLLAVLGGSGAAGVSVATGWTKVGGASGFPGTDSWGEVWYRFADGSEGSTASFTISDPINTGGIVFAYSNVASVGDTSANFARAATNSPPNYIGTLPTVDDGDWLVFSAYRNTGTAGSLTEPSGTTERHDQGGAMPSAMAVADQGPLSSAPSAQNWSLVGGDANYNVCGPTLLKAA